MFTRTNKWPLFPIVRSNEFTNIHRPAIAHHDQIRQFNFVLTAGTTISGPLCPLQEFVVVCVVDAFCRVSLYYFSYLYMYCAYMEVRFARQKNGLVEGVILVGRG